MENASKALLIAGGVLLAMMILAMLVYVSTSITDFSEAQDRDALTKQLSEFNKGFEAYNKKIMYGVDVISVVNKAINYNNSLDIDDKNYFINITLVLTHNYYSTVQTITTKADGTIEDKTNNDLSKGHLEANTYNLCTNSNSGETEMDAKILNFFDQPVDSYVYEEKNNQKIYRYSALTNFKKAVFKCTDLTYSDGRVKSMTFTEK